MGHRTGTGRGLGITVALLVWWTAGVAWAQPSASSQAGWTPPMTPWGEPDLRGIWPLNHLIRRC